MPFSNLPKEIRLMIWRYAMPSVIVDAEDPQVGSYADRSVFDLGGVVTTPMMVLSFVSHEAWSEAQFVSTGKLVLTETHEGEQSRCSSLSAPIDIENDTIKVIEMRLPFPRFGDSWLRNVLSVSFCLKPMPAREAFRLEQDRLYPVGRLALDRFPNMREITVVGLFSHHWARYGYPELARQDLRGRAAKCAGSSDEPLNWGQQVPFFREDLIQVSNRSLRRALDMGWVHGAANTTMLKRDLVPRINMANSNVNVSWIGFTRTKATHEAKATYGAEWAGFRYYVATHKVEFTPLSWPEVETATYACQNDYPLYIVRRIRGDRQLHFPMAVIRIFIVRAGETPPPAEPHHDWVEVPDYAPGMTRRQRMLREMWNGVASDFQEKRYTRGLHYVPKSPKP